MEKHNNSKPFFLPLIQETRIGSKRLRRPVHYDLRSTVPWQPWPMLLHSRKTLLHFRKTPWVVLFPFSEPRVSGPWRPSTPQQVSRLALSPAAVTLPGDWLWKVIFSKFVWQFVLPLLYLNFWFLHEVSMTQMEITLLLLKKKKNYFEMVWN